MTNAEAQQTQAQDGEPPAKRSRLEQEQQQQQQEAQSSSSSSAAPAATDANEGATATAMSSTMESSNPDKQVASAEAGPSDPSSAERKKAQALQGQAADEEQEQDPIEGYWDASLQVRRKILKEVDVGISEYLAPSVPPLRAVIKQRFSDFQVREVSREGEVLRITSLAPPPSSAVGRLYAREQAERADPSLRTKRIEEERRAADERRKAAIERENDTTWPEDADERLAQDGWTEEQIAQIKALYQQGRDFVPPAPPAPAGKEGESAEEKPAETSGEAKGTEAEAEGESKEDARGSGSRGGRGRGNGRDRRGGGRGADSSSNNGRPARGGPKNTNFVVSGVLADKAARSKAHATIRELFQGKFVTEAVDSLQLAKMEAAVAATTEGGESSSTPADAETKKQQQEEDDEDAAMNIPPEFRIQIKWGTASGRGDRRANNVAAASGPGSQPLSWQEQQQLDDKDEPKYVRFLMQKSNRDNADALGILTRHLNLVHSGGSSVSRDFAVAGTKDKRAVTVQAVTIARGRKTLSDIYLQANQCVLDVQGRGGPGGGGRGGRGGRGGGRGGRGGHNDSSDRYKTSLREVVTRRADRGVRIAHLEYVDKPLRLGDLGGNEFVITLRNVQLDTDEDGGNDDEKASQEALTKAVEQAVEVVRSRGYVNYFGMQRFGSHDISTHDLGIAVLRQEWKRVVDLILATSSADGEDARKARQLYREGQYSAAFEAMPRFMTAERGILGKMVKEARTNNSSSGGGDSEKKDPLGGDWLGYFLAAPQGLRIMYVHAFQSYLWNLMVSERVRMGDAAKAGDFIPAATAQANAAEGEDEGEEDGDAAPAEAAEGGKKRDARAPMAVEILTEETAAKYTLKDIVMPLPGEQVKLPDGWMRDMYVRELAKHKLKLEDLWSSPVA